MNTFGMYLGLLLMSLFVISCGNSKSKETYVVEDEPELVTDSNETLIDNGLMDLQVLKSKKTMLLTDYSNLKAFKEDINTYRIKFRSKYGALNNTHILCEKMNLSQTKRYIVEAIFHEEKEVEILLEIFDDDPNETNFLCKIKDKIQDVDRIKIKLLKSYIVSKNENWNTFLPTEQFETLLIEKDANLFSDDMSLVLQSRTLISLGGSIKTYPACLVDSTKPNSNGKSGGTIFISSQEAWGNLNVELRGLNGGIQTIVPEKNRATTERNMNNNGCKPEYSTPPKNESLCYGLKGHPGKQGTTGLKGFSGGDSGVLLLKVAKRNNFSLQIKYQPGNGGIGGIGGEGADGGQGGLGNYVSWVREASRNDSGGPFRMIMASPQGEKKYPDGPNGDQGPRGLNGANGEPGKNLDSDLKIEDLQIIVNKNYTLGESF